MIFGFINAYAANGKNIVIPPLFGDNMVLQRQTKVNLWGKASPDLTVLIKSSWGASSKTIVNKDGNWSAKLKTPKAGGPYEVSIQIGDTTITYKNVFSGEVWVCSGQSNMEMPLRGFPTDTVANSAQEINSADNPYLKLFTVTQVASGKQETDCIGKWVECNPETAKKFSATAYFFGKKLTQALKIPVGLIHSSWGGTPAESWTSGKALSNIEEYKNLIKKLNESQGEIKNYEEWIKSHPVLAVDNTDESSKWKNLDFKDSQCADTAFNDADWKTMKLPTLWESTSFGDFDGVIWFRKKIDIPKTWLNKDLVLELAAIDDMDLSYVNGVKVGGIEVAGYYATHRNYSVPAEIVKDSVLTIAVRVVDIMGGGGIWGNPELLKISLKDSNEMISLAGDWKFLPVAQLLADKFYLFSVNANDFYSHPVVPVSVSSNTPSALFNGMIAPLIPYTIKGVIWYQGEANISQPELYKKLFPAMIKSWRDEWLQGNFPFYYVQIAPWKYNAGSQPQKLREAQLFSLSTPKTGMAVTMDIGSPATIHPGKKKEVGDRLALLALKNSYNKNVICSGPVYKSIRIIDDKAILNFTNVNGGLVIVDKPGANNFMIAGEDHIFKIAEVQNNGKKLVLSSPDVKKPVAVRYGWVDYVDGTLFNKAGLPASSFRTDDWKD